MNADVKVEMWKDEDGEKADIKIGSIGMVSELRFDKQKLNAIATFTSLDIKRILQSIAAAETQRIEPNPKTIECIEFLSDRINYLDEDKSRLYLKIEAEMPIAACGSVKLVPNLIPEEQD